MSDRTRASWGAALNILAPGLLDPDEGKEEMKRYELTHRVTGAFAIIWADSAQGACQEMDWLIGDVYVQETTPS